MTIETYAEILQKRKENTMTNYDMDEIERKMGKRSSNIQNEKNFESVEIGKDDEELQTVEIEIDHNDLLKLALAAHDRDITLNQMCSTIIVDSMDSLDYKFEHQTKPTVLKEY